MTINLICSVCTKARFNNNEVEKLCEMLDGYTIEVDRDLPKNVWDYMRSERFFGLCIPKKYGGRGFSAHGHSMVCYTGCYSNYALLIILYVFPQTVTKIATRNPAACVTVMVLKTCSFLSLPECISLTPSF